MKARLTNQRQVGNKSKWFFQRREVLALPGGSGCDRIDGGPLELGAVMDTICMLVCHMYVR